jgi:poly-gamma-glutamate synthesis protein (capsule biosynthesis protein)
MLKTGKQFLAAVLTVAAVTAGTLGFSKQAMGRYEKQEVLISIAGDILLDRGVAEAVGQNGPAYPFGGITELFNRDDITVANLECPLTPGGSGALKEKKYVFKAEPASAGYLKTAGFDALILANNHTMDYQSAGLSDTMETLESAGLLYAGAGYTENDIKPCFIEKNGLRVGILAYSSLPPEGLIYDGGSATVAYARAGFLDGMRSDIASAAALCDFLLVYFHWGNEFRHTVSDAQIELAHAAADAGASAVIGTHPHVLQGREIYNGVPVYYSLGNFIFDRQIPSGTGDALIVQLTVGQNGIVDINELPVVIDHCQPQLADVDNAEDILANLSLYSRRFEN